MNWDTVPVGTSTAADLGIGGLEAESAAGLVPSLGAAGLIIGGGGAAIYTTWKITSSLQTLLTVGGEASTAPVAGFLWHSECNAVSGDPTCGIGQDGTSSHTSAFCQTVAGLAHTPCHFWRLWYTTGGVANPGPSGNWGGSVGISFCRSASDSHCTTTDEDANVRALGTAVGSLPNQTDGVPGTGIFQQWLNGGNANGVGCTAFCGDFYIIRSDAQMQAHTSAKPCDSACQAAASGGYQKDSSSGYTRGTTMTPTMLAAALCALGIGSGCSANDPTTPAHKAEIDVLKKAADPTYGDPVAPNCAGLSSSACVTAFSTAGFTATPTVSTASFSGADVAKPPLTVVTQSPGALVTADPASTVTITVNPADTDMPFAIPRPLVGETYADYIARLQSLGYIGAITYVDLDDTTGDLDLGPSGVPRVGIQIGTNTTTVQELTKSWPIPNPKIKAGSGITVYRNPTDFPAVTPEPTPVDPANPPPYEPGAGTPGTGVGGNCGPTVPTVDFAPITGVDFGSKFPFGIFGYIASALSPLVASPSAPVFDVPIYLMGDSFSLHVDFSPADPYMATIRLLMEIGIGITAVWLLAGSLLGFKAGSAGGGLDMDTSMGDD